MKIIPAKQAKGHFALFMQRDQQGIIMRHFTDRKGLFWNVVFVAVAVVAS